MDKTTFKVALCMPNYYSDGWLQINGEKVIAHFTNDKAAGSFKNGKLEFFLTKVVYTSIINPSQIDYFPHTESERIIIKIPELYSPMEYEFENDRKEDCRLEFISVDNSYNFN